MRSLWKFQNVIYGRALIPAFTFSLVYILFVNRSKAVRTYSYHFLLQWCYLNFNNFMEYITCCVISNPMSALLEVINSYLKISWNEMLPTLYDAQICHSLGSFLFVYYLSAIMYPSALCKWRNIGKRKAPCRITGNSSTMKYLNTF